MQLSKETLRILAETAPPPANKFKFIFAREANAEIARLETLLGMDRSAIIFNIGRANARVTRLEALLALKSESTSQPAKPAANPATRLPASLSEHQEKARSAPTLEQAMSRAMQEHGCSSPEELRVKLRRNNLAAQMSSLSGMDLVCAQANLDKLDAQLAAFKKNG